MVDLTRLLSRSTEVRVSVVGLLGDDDYIHANCTRALRSTPANWLGDR